MKLVFLDFFSILFFQFFFHLFICLLLLFLALAPFFQFVLWCLVSPRHFLLTPATGDPEVQRVADEVAAGAWIVVSGQQLPTTSGRLCRSLNRLTG